MRCKILVICGGGIFGCIPAHFLAMLPTNAQNMDGVNVLSGCSIGGILAAAYASGLPFGHIDKVFQSRAKECFTKRLAARLNPLTWPIYRGDKLDKVIGDILGDVRMYEVRRAYPGLALIIPALDLTDDMYLVFDNVRGRHEDIPLRDVAAFTSAAPWYFPGREYQGHCIVDGGLIEVAPLLTTVTGIKHNLRIPFCNMDVLMLGTGRDVDEKPLTPKRYAALSLLGLNTDVMVPYQTLGNEISTRYWGENLGLGSFVYFNPCRTNGKLDDVSLIPSLIEQTEQYRDDFLRTWEEWLSR